MKYWLDLFTWRTWNEFLNEGGTVSGFREKRWHTVQQMRPGDTLLCYMTGISRFFGLLEITGKSYKGTSPIWGEDIFPCRVPVQVVLALEPEFAVPVTELAAQLSYFQNMKAPNSWTGHFRGSPAEEKPQDAQMIITALREAQQAPISRPYDPLKLERAISKTYKTRSHDNEVTIPGASEDFDSYVGQGTDDVTHSEIQWLLLNLGSEMGLNVWVASNDRGRAFQNQAFENVKGMLSSLPIRYDPAINKSIELIDVLWLKDKTIVAAFEIEHSTSIYSGLLRLSDLVALLPNINIPIYIVAPDERRTKVFNEIARPTFSIALKPPLRDVCQYISYSSLKLALEEAGRLISYLPPHFLQKYAERFEEV